MTQLGETAMALYSRTGGEGRAIVLIHGLLGAAGNLGAQARYLQGFYHTIQVDLRNHGRSPHSAAMDYPLMAADVIALLDRQEVAQCALLGHSMGGKVAMELALTHPERIAALIVADIAPIAYSPDSHDTIYDAMRAVPLARIRNRQEADEFLSRYLGDAGMRQFLLANLYQQGGRYAWRANLAALIANRDRLSGPPPAVGPSEVPCLFIKGSDSDYITPSSAAPIRRCFPGARLRVIQGAGHWVHADKPAAFNRAAGRFLERYYPPDPL